MPEKNASSRIAGLDTLRAAAICLVLMSHYDGFVSRASTFGIVGDAGRAGVDLFFVLSGYLIGNQLLASRGLAGGVPLSNFFARRFLRTVPNYLVTVALYLAFPAVIGGSNALNLGRFLTFTQNFGMRYGATFSHSWSLCIEEQFYVLLPLAVLGLSALRQPSLRQPSLRQPSLRQPARVAWIAAGCAIAAGVAVRSVAYLKYGQDAFSAEVYYSSFCRADAFVPGVAIAMLKNFHPALYDRILKRGNTLLLAGLVAVTVVLSCMRFYFPNAGIVTAFGFSLLAIGFALLTLAALSPDSLLNRVRIPGATRLALWSYAVYLVHKPVFMALRPRLESWHVDAGAPLAVLCVFAAGIAAGWLLFVLVESPCMRLRSRWFPTAALPYAYR